MTPIALPHTGGGEFVSIKGCRWTAQTFGHARQQPGMRPRRQKVDCCGKCLLLRNALPVNSPAALIRVSGTITLARRSGGDEQSANPRYGGTILRRRQRRLGVSLRNRAYLACCVVETSRYPVKLRGGEQAGSATDALGEIASCGHRSAGIRNRGDLKNQQGLRPRTQHPLNLVCIICCRAHHG